MIDEFIFPKLADENIFEDLVTDIFMRRFKTYNFQRYGKKGQKQFGVDSVGPVLSKLIGVQIKNHPKPGTKITISDIDEEIRKSEKFKPILDEYYIVTSADRDVKAIAHVLSVSKKRVKQKKYPVYIFFWDDICHSLNEYPDMLYKYFIHYLPKEDFENLTNYQFSSDKSTINWPFDKSKLLSSITSNFNGAPLTSPYQLVVGISSFENIKFSGISDVKINLSDKEASSFETAANIFNQFKKIINSNKISKDLIFFPQTRIAFAFLLGWVFRKVTSHRITLVSNENQVWRTFDLPYVDPKLTENLPVFVNPEGKEIALVFNISRDIRDSVKKHFEKTKVKPKAILNYSVEGYIVNSSAQALSISIQLAKVIKNLVDSWDITRIHLFTAMPAGLATLIAYHTNAICPISIYYMDELRTNYILSGEITNNL